MLLKTQKDKHSFPEGNLSSLLQTRQECKAHKDNKTDSLLATTTTAAIPI